MSAGEVLGSGLKKIYSAAFHVQEGSVPVFIEPGEAEKFPAHEYKKLDVPRIYRESVVVESGDEISPVYFKDDNRLYALMSSRAFNRWQIAVRMNACLERSRHDNEKAESEKLRAMKAEPEYAEYLKYYDSLGSDAVKRLGHRGDATSYEMYKAKMKDQKKRSDKEQKERDAIQAKITEQRERWALFLKSNAKIFVNGAEVSKDDFTISFNEIFNSEGFQERLVLFLRDGRETFYAVRHDVILLKP